MSGSSSGISALARQLFSAPTDYVDGEFNHEFGLDVESRRESAALGLMCGIVVLPMALVLAAVGYWPLTAVALVGAMIAFIANYHQVSRHRAELTDALKSD